MMNSLLLKQKACGSAIGQTFRAQFRSLLVNWVFESIGSGATRNMPQLCSDQADWVRMEWSAGGEIFGQGLLGFLGEIRPRSQLDFDHAIQHDVQQGANRARSI
jgi:hypothetical protein